MADEKKISENIHNKSPDNDHEPVNSFDYVVSRAGPKFDKLCFIGAPKVIPPIFYDVDPELFINKMVGVWTGKLGVDTVFIKPKSQLAPGGGKYDTGFSTTYEETVSMSNIAGNILNPHQISKDNPSGVLNGAQMIFGLRYLRMVTSTQVNSHGSDNPFKKPKPIHDEAGYILFAYTGSIDGGKTNMTLTRIIHSLAVPRGVTMQARCDVKNINHLPGGGMLGNGSLEYQVDADTKSIPWNVVSNQHLQAGGKITKFSMKNTFNFTKEGKGSTWKYTQETPFLFPAFGNVPSPHENVNTLTKM